MDNNNTCKDNGRGGAISTLGAGKLQIYNTDFTNNDAAIGRTIAVYGSSGTTFIYIIMVRLLIQKVKTVQ